MKGKIIVIEGTDCSGKETQSKLLEQYLNENKVKCIRMSFPAYDTPTGKIVGGPYLGKEEICASFFEEGPARVNPYISSLYYAADRKYCITKVMEYIHQGYIVILNRYTTSNMAHQGGKIDNADERFHMYQWIDKLEFWLLDLPKPDITIFLHMPYEYSCELKKNRTSLDGHEKSKEHLIHAEQAYIELSELYHWDVIECVQDKKIKTIDQIQQEIIDLLNGKGID